MSGAEEFGVPGDPLIGQVVEARYKIAHAIGRGAMGVVYEAQHLLIGRKVALKTMIAHSVSPAGVERFHREARAAAAVGSSHVVDVLDMGQLDSGLLYIVMEHLAGVDLGFAVAVDRRFSVGRAIHVLGQLCDALSAIHTAGIIHRDLKPENIFLTTRDGAGDFVKVLDFGVCKFSDAEGGRLTATGDTIGTPLFMAPEQVAGRNDCDHRVDIYALGAILYFVLTGQAPFDAPNLPALFLRICHEPVPSLASTDSPLSFELDAIVQRALSKNPSERFSSCSAFKAALRALQATPDEVAATLPSAVHDPRRTKHALWNGFRDNDTLSRTRSQGLRRPRWLGIGIGVAVVALVVSTSSRAHLVRTRAVEPSAEPHTQGVTSTVQASLAVPPVAESARIGTQREAPRARKRTLAIAVASVRPIAAGVGLVPALPLASAPSPGPLANVPSAPASQISVLPSSASPPALDLHFTQGPKRDL